ncbi:FtsX-like permease family protein [Sporofaciens sp. SGI.106]|uniref:FtsX-like permease family protein n=1 Tax=Sporofaciens sp. SGI.106 TaxID=3420568 RepID=UPI003CFC447A
MKKRRRKSSVYYVQVIIGLLVVLSLFFVKYYMEGQYYFCWEIISKWITEKKFCPEYLPFLEESFFAFLFGIRTLLLITKGHAGLLYHLSGFSLWFSCAPFLIFTQMQDPLPYVGPCGILLILFLIEFLGLKFLEQKEEIEEIYETSRKREREEKEHRKRANDFPGQYPKEFYGIVRSHFRYYWKEQMTVLLAATLISAITQTVLAVFLMTQEIYRKDGTFNFFIGEGIYKLFRNLGLILIVLSICMMYMICSWYIREQRRSFRLLVILGIRKRTAYLIFLCGYTANILGGAILGTLAGMAASILAKNALLKGFQESIAFTGGLSFTSIGIGLLLYLIEMLLALAFNQDSFLAVGESTDMTDDVRADYFPQKKLPVYIFLGVCFYGLGCIWFSIREWAEMDFIHILTVSGCVLLIIGVFAYFLKKRREKEQYYEKLFHWNTFYYRFWKNMGSLCFLSVLHFCVLAIFAVQLIGAVTKQDVEEMYPYDFVYKAYESEIPELETIIQENEIQAEQYPMMVMTSIYGSDKLANWGSTRPIQWPQGQHIAVSESTYYKLKEAKGEESRELDLDQEEMHVVYQQDLSAKAHTIDWDSTRIQKHLRFGQPLIYYNTADYQNVFPGREIKSEEKSSLTGIFCQGMQENLIVMTDEYFEKNWKMISSYNREQWSTREQAELAEWRNYTRSHNLNMTEGPTVLFCMNVPEGRRENVENELAVLAEARAFDQTWDSQIQPFYAKVQMMDNLKSEILFTGIAYGFIVWILTLISFFQYFVYVRKEEKGWKWDDVFLNRMGMRQKERKEKIDFQLKIYMFVPLLIGIVSGIIFTALTLKARLFTPGEVVQYAEKMGIVYAVYICIHIGIYKLEKKHIKHLVGEEK